MKTPLLLLLLFPVLVACGDPDQGDSSATTATEIEFDLDSIPARDWEIYMTSFSRYEEVVGRVVDPDGNPFPGAVATLILLPKEQMVAPLELQEARTDEDGFFRLEDVPADGWIMVEARGYAGRMVRVRALQPGMGETTEVQLRPGAEVSGKVARVDGSPVGGVRLDASNPFFDWAAIVTTDGDGRYRIPVAPVGPISIGIIPGSHVGERQHLEVEAGVPSIVNLTVVDVLPVEGVVLDEATQEPIADAVVRTFSGGEILAKADETGRFVLSGAHGPLAFVLAPGYAEAPLPLDQTRTDTQTVTVMLRRGASAAGRVETPEGEPIEDARIIFVGDPDGTGVVFWGPHTRADGRFLFDWLPEPPGDRSGFFLALTADRLADIGERETILAGRRVSREIVLRPVPPVSAHLVVLTEDGDPIPDVSVSLRHDGEAYPQAVRYYLRNADGTITGPDGSARLRGLRPGPQVLDIWIEGRAPFVKKLTLGSDPDQDLGSIVVPNGLRIAGRIKSTGGKLPEDSGVDLSEVGGDFHLATQIAEDGSFEFWGLEDKPFLLRVGSVGHETVQKEVKAGDADIEVIMKLLGALKIVTVHPDGTGPGGNIELVRKPVGRTGARPVNRPFANAGDTLEIPRLAPGSYVVRVETEDRSWCGLGEARVRPGQSESVTVEMKKAGRLYGTVLRSDGTPAAEVGVSYDAGEAWGSRGVNTDSEGKYSLPGIPEGRIVLQCHPFGHARLEEALEIGPAEEKRHDVTLIKGASLTLRVTNRATGEAVEGVTASLANDEGVPARFWIKDRRQARTDGEGKLELVGIRPGNYRLSLFLDSIRLEMRVVELSGDEVLDIAVDL